MVVSVVRGKHMFNFQLYWCNVVLLTSSSRSSCFGGLATPPMGGAQPLAPRHIVQASAMDVHCCGAAGLGLQAAATSSWGLQAWLCHD